MTLIIGYIYNSSVHLIADTASTVYRNIEEKKQNSFGEVSELTDGFETEESLNKLYIFGKHLAGGFAGLDHEGNKILYDLKMHLRYFPDKKIKDLLVDFFTKNKPSETEYIFGFKEDNKSYIFQYIDSKYVIESRERAYVGIGNGIRNGEIQESLRTIDTCLQNLSGDINEALVLSTGVIQNFVLVNDSCFTSHFKSGYGGLISGLLIEEKGVKESCDTVYILYSNNFFEKGEKFIVQKLIRENVVAVNSAKDQSPFSLYINDITGEFNLVEWLKKWGEDLRNAQRKFKFEYLVFISYDSRIVSYISKDNPRFKDLIKIDNVGSKNVGIHMNESLLNCIIKSNEELNPSGQKEGFSVVVNKL